MKKQVFTLLLLVFFKYNIQSQICFGPEITTPILDSGQGIVSEDFNGDGKPDLAVALGYQNEVQVLKGNGAGGFTSAGVHAMMYGPEYLTSGDFDGDGKMDIGAVNGVYTATVFRGNGNLGFSAITPTDMTTGYNPVWIANGDFNGDGKKDLVTANEQSNNVTVILATGNTYGPPALFYTGQQPHCVAVADFNSDGKKDIVTADLAGNTITLLLGDGQGGFGAPLPFPTDFSPGKLIVDDFNNDNKPDVVTSNSGANTATTTISVLLNNGQSGFNLPVNLFVGAIPGHLTSADFNGDGNKDIAVILISISGGTLNGQLVIFTGKGSGGFSAPHYIPVSTSPSFILAQDFNMDGKKDIAVCSGNSISVFLNTTPFLSMSSIPPVLCPKHSATISAGGTDAYVWSDGSTGPSVTVSPTLTTVYSVTATAAGCTNSAAYSMSVNACVGLSTITPGNSFLKLYPNPAADQVIIDSQSDTDLSLSNELGQFIKQVHVSASVPYRLSVTDLPPGIYFVSGKTDGQRVNLKLILAP